MVTFHRLRLNGFKSFVDRTELDIQPGLTGIVGPNGCGKSNLVEGLRWVMGANNARHLRGDQMDDVIFSGTTKRPGRNHAEVAIVLNNASGNAPAPYTSVPEIEIVRRIDRDQGSNYTINGRSVRARDVQVLFADLTSGASSAAMVGQGRVTSIINAKPSDRRALLEEAAGVSGLYSRRQEAEQRLRAAEENVTKLQEMIERLENQASTLRRQARQATRYKELNVQIREADLQISLLQWQDAVQAATDVHNAYSTAETETAASLLAVTQYSQQADDLAAKAKPQQIALAEAKAALQSMRQTRQQYVTDAERTAQETADLTTMLTQLQNDVSHETALQAELEETLTHLAGEAESLQDKLAKGNAVQEQAETDVAALRTSTTALESTLQNALQDQTRQHSARADAEATLAREDQRLRSYQDRLQTLTNELETTLAPADTERMDALSTQVTTYEAAIAAAVKAEQDAFNRVKTARVALEASLTTRKSAREDLDKVEIEIKSLRPIVESASQPPSGRLKAVVADMQVRDGYATALARALGEALQAPVSNKGDHGWADLGHSPEFNAWPAGVTPMGDLVVAPQALARALSLIGVVEDTKDVATLLPQLQIGQILVNKEGHVWRWDGYASRRTQADAASVLLTQKNRLQALDDTAPALREALSAAETHVAALEQDVAKAEQDLTTQREMRLSQEAALRDASQSLQSLKNQHAQSVADRNAKQAAQALLQDDIKTLETQMGAMKDRLVTLQDSTQDTALATKVQDAQDALRAAQENLQSAISYRDLLVNDGKRYQARVQAIGDERVSIQNRLIRAREQLQKLQERQDAAQERLQSATSKPDALAEAITKLDEKIAAQDTLAATLHDDVQGQDKEYADLNALLKTAQAALMQARENSARLGERVEIATQRKAEWNEKIEQDFDQSPLILAASYALDLLNLATLTKERDQLQRARDGLGPVNLLAEDEYTKTAETLEKLIQESQDLTQAVQELRTAVNKLNSEARERLSKSFHIINGHFETLFTQLFGGGQARLALTEGDDPLAAGLEIFAQPPGKSLQSMSLLSGGEQTLTAIALIFAMFLTNPAPLCVLDEIDAPLDDANVDRVCNVLEHIAATTQTRFLIVTHHRLTMARMHRLYGVTMAERGVSQLLSLNLQSTFGFQNAA
ncbi:MAG: chromosome segregation protein SMC [Pseudomonadota bacterium]